MKALSLPVSKVVIHFAADDEDVSDWNLFNVNTLTLADTTTIDPDKTYIRDNGGIRIATSAERKAGKDEMEPARKARREMREARAALRASSDQQSVKDLAEILTTLCAPDALMAEDDSD
jgi:hypothetical protein